MRPLETAKKGDSYVAQKLNNLIFNFGEFGAGGSQLWIIPPDWLSVSVPSPVTREQVEAFRQSVLEGSGKRNYAVITVMAYAGLRVSECLAFVPEDVSLTAREITVRNGKGGKTRVVFIGDKVVNRSLQQARRPRRCMPLR